MVPIILFKIYFLYFCDLIFQLSTRQFCFLGGKKSTWKTEPVGRITDPVISYKMTPLCILTAIIFDNCIWPFSDSDLWSRKPKNNDSSADSSKWYQLDLSVNIFRKYDRNLSVTFKAQLDHLSPVWSAI